MVGSSDQDYNHNIFIAAPTKKNVNLVKNCINSEFIISELVVGSGEIISNHASLIFITAVTKKNLDSRNSKLVVGYGEQDYNDAFLIFITAVTKKT